MPEPGKVTDPDLEDAQLTIGKIITLNNGEMPFINTCPDLDTDDPVLYEIRNYNNGEMEFAVLPTGWDDLKKNKNKMKWRNKNLHKEWKNKWKNLTEDELAELGMTEEKWKDYRKYDESQTLI